MSDLNKLDELVKYMRANGVLAYKGFLDEMAMEVTLHPESVATDLAARELDATPATPDDEKPRDADGLTGDEQEALYGHRFVK